MQIIKGQPNTPCPRYDGKLKTLPTQGNILSCNGAENPVVRLFGVENRNQDYWKEESSKACHTLRNDCNKCRNECTISSLKNPVCSLTRSNTLHDSKQEYGEHLFELCVYALQIFMHRFTGHLRWGKTVHHSYHTCIFQWGTFQMSREVIERSRIRVRGVSMERWKVFEENSRETRQELYPRNWSRNDKLRLWLHSFKTFLQDQK